MKNEIRIISTPSIDYKNAIDEIAVNLKNRLDKLDVANLVCNEESVKSIKNLRTELTKESKEYEEKRIAIKNEVLKPYLDFEMLYNEKIKSQYQLADVTLKTNISKVENEALDLKKEELLEYFKSLQIDETKFLKLEDVGLNIILSATTTSLKKQIFEFFETVNSDLELIKTQENSERIMNYYHKSLDVKNAIVSVTSDIKKEIEIAKMNIEKEEKLRLKKEQEPIDTPFTQVVEKPKQAAELNMTFTVKATKEKLIALKQYMEREGIKYE